MTFLAHSKNISNFISAFILKHGSDETLDKWNDTLNIQAFNQVLLTTLKPKRGKSAYIYFCSDKRAEAKNELGDVAKATEVTSLLGKMWKELNEDQDRSEEMEKYTKLAADDKARYENIGVKKPVTKTKKLTGYTYFCQVNRPVVKTDNPGMKLAEVTKELARLWKERSVDDKKAWSCAAKLVNVFP
jgi:hypothetical protein